MITKNQTLTLTVTDVNNLGYGVAHHGGLTVFVGGAIDGETVEATVLTVKKTYAVAKTTRVLTPSPHRVENDCPARGCGGCAYRNMTYAHELTLKGGYVASAFRKVGLSHLPVLSTLSTGVTSHYRNKAQYPVTRLPDGSYRIGFYAPKSHRVVEASNCPLGHPVFGEMIETVRGYLTAHSLSTYDEATGEGLIRHLYFRRATRTDEVLLTVVANGTALPHEGDLVARLTAAHPSLVGILLNTNTEMTNVICGDTYRTLWGRDFIEDILAGVRLRISAPAFYQVNHAATELLYAKAAELASLTGKEQLLDLYCGTGSIGLSMARKVRELIGIEIIPEAVENARENARLNGIENAHFFCGDAGNTRHLLDAAASAREIHPDVVVLDPPRKGCAPELLDYLAQLSIPKIVYISCNPDTLARDVKHLLSLGYSSSAVTPVDLFPRTGHVESLVCLQKQAN